MKKYAPKIAHWHDHIHHVQVPSYLQSWLTETGSLTAKLIAHSSSFRVQRIYQGHTICWADECTTIGLHKITMVQAREVLLCCNNVPIVYARTVLPMNSHADQWPQFKNLGEKSLGSILFNDPQVKRSALQFARLSENHPAVQRIRGIKWQSKLDYTISTAPFFARRSLFFRHGGVMLVMELFLPTLSLLKT